MKHTLVGYTGFVVGNLAAAHPFDWLYNSKNIRDSFGADNGLVIYSGMASEKYLANADPAADLAKAEEAMDNIRRMRPEQLVLISTVDVYPDPECVYEDTPAGGEDGPAYGANRLQLEHWVRAEYPQALIVSLPGLFGKGLKKNFIYDMLTITPAALKPEKYEELARREPLVADSYLPGDGGFYRLQPLDGGKADALRRFFEGNDFNALAFTDSRSVFQFYNLARLWKDIEGCLGAGLPLANLAVAPVEAGELYQHLTGKSFVNHLEKPPADYDMRTRFALILGGEDGYLADKQQVLAEIAAFAEGWQLGNR